MNNESIDQKKSIIASIFIRVDARAIYINLHTWPLIIIFEVLTSSRWQMKKKSFIEMFIITSSTVGESRSFVDDYLWHTIWLTNDNQFGQQQQHQHVNCEIKRVVNIPKPANWYIHGSWLKYIHKWARISLVEEI